MAQKMIEQDAYIYHEITQLFPNARCELKYTTQIELLIAIILSAQTTDDSVNRVTDNLFNKYHCIQDYADVNLSELENDIHHLGLFKNKARYIKLTCIKLRDQYAGIVPNDQKALESFPGVGRKTANVFISEWYKMPRIAIDTHVKRVSIRLGLVSDTDSLEQIENRLMAKYDPSNWIDLHHKLIFFGRYFCTAKLPKCKQCPLLSICQKPLL
ncbi:MAG: endonuclease III [Candidatus Izemoplasmatales bacterium]|jgi:endonuclease-3|nr:endonuclease III [Candidatus Izemoplasmatales bacterium]